MFRAAHRSSSGALNYIYSLWFIYPCGDRPLSRLSGKWIHFPLSPDNSRSPHGYINQRLQIQFRAPDEERCAARNMLNLQINFREINSFTKLHLVGISTESYGQCRVATSRIISLAASLEVTQFMSTILWLLGS